MKIAIIGGAGVRVPLLANGLATSDLPINEIALFDIDQDRLAIIGSLASQFAPCVRQYADAEGCISDADIVFLSIRAGGIRARARDEAIALEHGAVAQETVGPGGFAMAMRNAPRAVEYAQLVERTAPRAWVINFTNPVGIVTQAMMTASSARVIGICDTPTELFEDVAQFLGLESNRCRFDYFGLNHLGWLREVFHEETPQLGRLWGQPELLDRVYRVPLFEPTFLQALGLLPTEYLFYYYRPDAAIANTRKASQTRGAAIAELNDRLFRDLAQPNGNRRRVYEAYLESRSAGYMQIESGSTQPVARSPWADLTGYDKIALSVVRAIHFNSNAVIPLNVANRGSIGALHEADIVEVPCVVNEEGATPVTVERVPDAVRDLLVRVKEYERLTVDASRLRSNESAVRALAANPLVRDVAMAERLVHALGPFDAENA